MKEINIGQATVVKTSWVYDLLGVLYKENHWQCRQL